VSDRCFMVESVGECWDDAGNQRVGAMFWRRHGPAERDAAPRPFPHLAVMTRAGLACLDCPESDPPYRKWEWTGEPPNVTVHPSLDVDKDGPHHWHGHLTDGELR